MTNEMIERVEKAIRDELKKPIIDTEKHLDKAGIRMAKAVIKAMREPTEEMMTTGYDYGCWQRMIDAALSK